MVMIKVLVFTGLCNAGLGRIRLQDVDLGQCQIRVVPGKGGRDRTMVFPTVEAVLTAGREWSVGSYVSGSLRICAIHCA